MPIHHFWIQFLLATSVFRKLSYTFLRGCSAMAIGLRVCALSQTPWLRISQNAWFSWLVPAATQVEMSFDAPIVGNLEIANISDNMAAPNVSSPLTDNRTVKSTYIHPQTCLTSCIMKNGTSFLNGISKICITNIFDLPAHLHKSTTNRQCRVYMIRKAGENKRNGRLRRHHLRSTGDRS